MFGVEPVAFGEEFQPPLLFGFDDGNRTFAQFQQPDAAVLHQAPALFIAQAEVMDGFRALGPQGLAQQPDGVGRLELVVAVPVLELRAVEIRPAVEDAGRQVRDVEQLDFDLVQPSGLVAGLDVDDAEFVVEKFTLVVGVENLDGGDRGGEFAGQDGVKIPATLLFSALNAELAAGSKPAFHVLGAIGARSPHDVVVGIGEGGNDDFAFGGIGIAAAQSTESASHHSFCSRVPGANASSATM